MGMHCEYYTVICRIVTGGTLVSHWPIERRSVTETTMSMVERWKKRMGYLFVLECNYAQESATETTMSIVERWKEEKYGLSFCSRVQSCIGKSYKSIFRFLISLFARPHGLLRSSNYATMAWRNDSFTRFFPIPSNSRRCLRESYCKIPKISPSMPWSPPNISPPPPNR